MANQGGREREDMVANIHEFVNDPVGEINGTAYHVSGRRDELMEQGLIPATARLQRHAGRKREQVSSQARVGASIQQEWAVRSVG